MIQLLDAEPRPLPWGLVYSALQVGLVDGAENNITALVYGRHAEVVKYFSFTEHTMVPDVLLMNRQAWERLSKSQQDTLRSAAAESSLLQSILWEQAESRSRFEAERMGITFVHPNKAAFVAKLAALKQELAERAGLAGLIAKIEQA
jgi:TRAP-type C4-dicarboxylate transport system substrate-binding protein